MTASSVKSKSPQVKSSLRTAASGLASPLQRRQLPSQRQLYKKLDSYQKQGVDFALAVETAALLFGRMTAKSTPSDFMASLSLMKF